MQTSRVGMGMPVYNGERFLEESLRANLAQTYADFSLYITNNASTDRTEEICLDYAARDKRIRYIRNPVNVGAPGNFTRCFEAAKSEYFRWTTADDLPEPTLVEKCVKILDAHPDTVLAYGKTRIIDGQGAVLKHYDDNLDLQEEKASDRFRSCLERIGLCNVIYGLLRRDAIAKTGLLGNYPAADINLIAELALYGKFHEIPDHLFSRRFHMEASSWDRKDSERQRSFWNPSKRKLVMQTWRSLLDHHRASWRAPIPLAQKRAILYYLLKKAFWAKKSMLEELHDLVPFGEIKRAPTA